MLGKAVAGDGWRRQKCKFRCRAAWTDFPNFSRMSLCSRKVERLRIWFSFIRWTSALEPGPSCVSTSDLLTVTRGVWPCPVTCNGTWPLWSVSGLWFSSNWLHDNVVSFCKDFFTRLGRRLMTHSAGFISGGFLRMEVVWKATLASRRPVLMWRQCVTGRKVFLWGTPRVIVCGIDTAFNQVKRKRQGDNAGNYDCCQEPILTVLYIISKVKRLSFPEDSGK